MHDGVWLIALVAAIETILLVRLEVDASRILATCPGAWTIFVRAAAGNTATCHALGPDAAVRARDAARALVGRQVAGEIGAGGSVTDHGAAIRVSIAANVTFLVRAAVKARACRTRFVAG